MRHVAIKRFGPIREIDIDLDKSLEVIPGSGKKKTSAENSVIRKEFRVAPGSVGAYFISAENGCLRNIVSEKRGLIDALQIDGISESINERMDRILYRRAAPQF